MMKLPALAGGIPSDYRGIIWGLFFSQREYQALSAPRDPEAGPLVPGGIIPLSVSLDFTVVLELTHGRNKLKLPQNKSRKKYRSKKICPAFHASALRQAREARQGSVPL
jgi:hypothetical protein